MDPLIISLLQTAFQGTSTWILPQLATVSISVPSWDDLSVSMGLSPQLRHLTLDLGFNKARIDAKGWSNDAVAAGYLKQVVSMASLERLDLRGMALGCDGIASALASMKSLRVLTLTTGNSLTAHTLAAIVAFPRLSELEFHAGHIDAHELAAAIATHNAPSLPTLEKLRVRAQAPLVELLLEKMTSCRLTNLFIEAEQPAKNLSSWTSTFSLIPTKTANTLHELTIEHHIDLSTDTDSNNTNSTTHFDTPTLASLRPLAKLPHLRRLVLDTTIPPNLCDADVEVVAKWWPHIQHLELGGLLSDKDCLDEAWTARPTLGCLGSFARLCPQLETLVINLDVHKDASCYSDVAKASAPAQRIMRNLAIGSTSPPDPTRLSRYLRRIFPSLEVIDGIAAHEDEFRLAQAMLHETQ